MYLIMQLVHLCDAVAQARVQPYELWLTPSLFLAATYLFLAATTRFLTNIILCSSLSQVMLQ